MATSHYPNCIPVSYLEHWVHCDILVLVRNEMPCSQPNTLIQCEGCIQHFSYYVGDLRPKCILQIKHHDLILIDIYDKKKRQELITFTNRNVNTFQLLKYSNPHYRILVYNDFLFQQKKIPPFFGRPIAPPSLTKSTFNNDKIIQQLINNDQIVKELQDIVRILHPLPALEFYTDGSFNADFSINKFPMGYGWTTSNLDYINITYSGSIKFFPSATKAEVMAILTALIVCPPDCKVTIYMDL
ncbi:hypothetical protein RhiirC2_790735 [Rhizophagus irregularis]|uniref:RNase H type-1 domain-containing protein n=1 Tax=Rhizophagus irregularis TaxID=588596 RepID=A0A2N1MKN5_9GLOM|nr:hypothetical protein RhiirC2_790735 [Rhizophagus irregularis]